MILWNTDFLAIFFIFDVDMPIFGDNGGNIPKLTKIFFKTHQSKIWAKYDQKRLFLLFGGLFGYRKCIKWAKYARSFIESYSWYFGYSNLVCPLFGQIWISENSFLCAGIKKKVWCIIISPKLPWKIHVNDVFHSIRGAK